MTELLFSENEEEFSPNTDLEGALLQSWENAKEGDDDIYTIYQAEIYLGELRNIKPRVFKDLKPEEADFELNNFIELNNGEQASSIDQQANAK